MALEGSQGRPGHSRLSMISSTALTNASEPSHALYVSASTSIVPRGLSRSSLSLAR